MKTINSTDVGELNGDNPGPFQQPLLVFHTNTHGCWYVDVEGSVRKYLSADEPGTTYHQLNINHATPLLKELCRRLRSQGISVHQVATYTGSAGPSHILKHGVFFERMSIGAEDLRRSTGWMDM
jgi:hypothetical protein